MQRCDAKTEGAVGHLGGGAGKTGAARVFGRFWGGRAREAGGLMEGVEKTRSDAPLEPSDLGTEHPHSA